MTTVIRNPLRVNLSREEIKQIKVKAAENDRSMAQFVADHLRESLKLNAKRNVRR